MQRITHSLFALFASLVLVTVSLTVPTLNTPDFAAAEHNVNGFCFEAPISTFAAVPINPTTYTVRFCSCDFVYLNPGNIFIFSVLFDASYHFVAKKNGGIACSVNNLILSLLKMYRPLLYFYTEANTNLVFDIHQFLRIVFYARLILLVYIFVKRLNLNSL